MGEAKPLTEQEEHELRDYVCQAYGPGEAPPRVLAMLDAARARIAELEREAAHCAAHHVPQLKAISGALLDAGVAVGDVGTFADAIRLLAAEKEGWRDRFYSCLDARVSWSWREKQSEAEPRP
jgi:hypothetical protein